MAKAPTKAKAKAAPAVRTRSKTKAAPEPKTRAKAAKAVAADEPKGFRPDYDDMLDQVERKFKLGQGSMSKAARETSQFSTGLLCTDLMLGGGLLPGAWYTIFGGEGSAKSTHKAHFTIAAADSGIPIMADFDYEGSSQPDYYEGIFQFASSMREVSELYGLKDEDGSWVQRPKVRYYNPTVAEDFFNSAASTLRRIPNKEFVDGRWWYTWDPTQEGRAASKGQHSKSMFTKYGRLFVEAENGLPQALYFLDSYPAMYPEALDEDDKGKGMAAVARAMSENVPKIFSKLRSKGVTIVGVNQLRQRPAVMYGSPEYEPGGETLKFASSVRIRQSALSVPSGWGKDKDNTGLGKETSAMNDGSDSYRYIKMKTIKNKLSTPYLTMMQRVWTDDGTGSAHGFCPAYDTFNYLKATGQVTGTMKNLKSALFDTKKQVDWTAFKGLIVLKGKELREHCAELGLAKNPNVRVKCFEQIKSGKGTKMYFDRIRSKSGGGDDDDDGDE